MKVPHISGGEVEVKMTCADCMHISLCHSLGFMEPGNTDCDFFPSRFKLSPLTQETQND